MTPNSMANRDLQIGIRKVTLKQFGLHFKQIPKKLVSPSIIASISLNFPKENYVSFFDRFGTNFKNRSKEKS